MHKASFIMKKNIMYRIGFIWFYFFFCSRFSPELSFGCRLIVATVNIYNAQIISQSDRTFSLSFDLSNDTGVQSQVAVFRRLTKATATGDLTVDEQVYPNIFSIDQNTTINQSVTYTAPASLSCRYLQALDRKQESKRTYSCKCLCRQCKH